MQADAPRSLCQQPRPAVPQPGQAVGPAGQQDQDVVPAQPPQSEQQRPGRRQIGPLQVVNDDRHRPSLLQRSEHVQQRRADRETACCCGAGGQGRAVPPEPGGHSGAQLLGNTMIDPQRLAQEAALLADRGDIGEEISRLQIHSRQLDEILNSGGEVGKRLDFLLQELNRETNTILSKTSGLGDLGLRITELALASKAAIEKIREQALNLE